MAYLTDIPTPEELIKIITIRKVEPHRVLDRMFDLILS